VINRLKNFLISTSTNRKRYIPAEILTFLQLHEHDNNILMNTTGNVTSNLPVSYG